MMSSNQTTENRGPSHTTTLRGRPLQVVHIVGNLMRIWSVYSMYSYLSQTGASVILFVFSCLVPSSLLFLLLQKPWKGRPLSNTQVIPSLINGVVTALYFITWGKGVKSCGPLRAVMAEYSGAVLGVLSAVLYGRRGSVGKKVIGLSAMLASFYLLSRGWSMTAHFPLKFSNQDDEPQLDESFKGESMMIPVLAGILSALRRAITRRASLKNQLKKRLNAITIASAICFLFPVAMWDIITGSTTMDLPFSFWPFSSVILFGIILIFYVDSLAEERLRLVFSSLRHFIMAGGCIIVMEITYKMDFSLSGFLLCATILGFGIHEATSLDRINERSSKGSALSNGNDEISPLPI